MGATNQKNNPPQKNVIQSAKTATNLRGVHKSHKSNTPIEHMTLKSKIKHKYMEDKAQT